jgi:phage shock protein PspC (stress-responsive transcriptional regulator)
MTIWLIVAGIAIRFDLQTEIVTSIAIASLYGVYFVILIQCSTA